MKGHDSIRPVTTCADYVLRAVREPGLELTMLSLEPRGRPRFPFPSLFDVAEADRLVAMEESS